MTRRNDLNRWIRRDNLIRNEYKELEKKYNKLFKENIKQYNLIQQQADEISDLEEKLEIAKYALLKIGYDIFSKNDIKVAQDAIKEIMKEELNGNH